MFEEIIFTKGVKIIDVNMLRDITTNRKRSEVLCLIIAHLK